MHKPMRVAVLGLGGMGRALAHRLQTQGHDVVVWNRTPGKGGDLREAESAADAVDTADTVFVVVHDGAAVLQVCTEELLAAFAPGAHLLIVSTVTPEVVRQLEPSMPGRVLDTPVLGSPDMVMAGQGQFFVGGEAATLQAVTQLLGDLGNYTCCGALGSASVIKILSNTQLVVGVAALAEAVATARAQGVTDDVLNAVFGDSLMVSRGASFGLPALLDPNHEGQLGPVGDASYDVRLALELAAKLNLALFPGALELLGRVADQNCSDFSAVIEGLT